MMRDLVFHVNILTPFRPQRFNFNTLCELVDIARLPSARS